MADIGVHDISGEELAEGPVISRRTSMAMAQELALGAQSSEDGSSSGGQRPQRLRRRRSRHISVPIVAYALLASSLPSAMAQTCIPLKSSTQCPAFHAASISTDSTVTGLFPFLSTVSDTSSFDSGLEAYISAGFAQVKYQDLLGCSNFQADNTTDFYARYTTTVLCNAIIQNSIQACGLTGNAARPLCADSCAAYAESEEQISASNICGSASSNALTQIRADFTNCALPADSLTQQCIDAVQNQPDNCGFNANVAGLCSYCAASSPNATDSCCVFSQTEKRCKNVVLPVVATSALKPIGVTTTSHSSSTGTSTSTATGAAAAPGLSGGQIAGIVVGSILGALLLLALVIGGCLFLRRRKEKSPTTSVFNQPTPSRQQPPMSSYRETSRDQERGLTALPPARVARMSALEATGPSGRKDTSAFRHSTTDEEDSPGYGAGAAPPPKRSGSLSSASQLAVLGAGTGDLQDTSPSTGNNTTSPESQGQSEQLGFFKDYYSQDEIHPGDLVATLWAYEPRAADEFALERGDMIKVIGIWDDGWATGVRVRQKAEDWRPDDKVLRDSGLSNGSSKPPDTADGGEVKAFPMVCVCLPQHWRKTIEGESTEGSGPPDIP